MGKPMELSLVKIRKSVDALLERVRREDVKKAAKGKKGAKKR